MTKNKKKNNAKPKRNYLKNEPEVYWYLNTKGEKLWGYRHRYYDALDDRREKSAQGLTTETIAVRGLLEVKSELINGNAKSMDNVKITISEWLDIWFETHKDDLEISTRTQREQTINLHLKPLLGKYRLSKLTRTIYKQKFINVLLKSHEPSSVLQFHRVFKTAINAAVEDEIIPRNRVNKIVIDDDKIFENYFDPSELKTFLLSVKEHEKITFITATLLLAYTGMRRGEAQGLKWSDLDVIKSSINIERTRDDYGVRKPKTKNSYREIQIDEIVVEQLRIYKVWCKEVLLSFGRKLSENDYIFISDKTGLPMSRTTLTSAFNRMNKNSGVRRITPHGLRHTHATILISNGIPLKTVADRLGNTPEMILKIYGHALKEFETKSVIAFSEAVNL